MNAGLPDGHAHDDESSPRRGRMTNPVLSCMFGFLCFLRLKSQVHRQKTINLDRGVFFFLLNNNLARSDASRQTDDVTSEFRVGRLPSMTKCLSFIRILSYYSIIF